MFDNDELNEAQQEAVCCTEGPLLVLAGAGSGKTRVITHRIAFLVREMGVSPWSVLALTFTNKAASEMRSRVGELVGPVRGMWVTTFHSAAVRLLRENARLLGYRTTFVIYDDADRLNAVKNAMKELNIDDSRFKPRGVLAAISRFKNELGDADTFEEQADNYYLRNVARIFRAYQQRLQANNAMDFDDLLLLLVKLFRDHPEVLARYRQQFRYILVDEYQDTNRVQYEIIRLLAGEHRNICVVGDDDQSIYQFRGADLRNILNFERDWPEVRVVKLEQNYRSTGHILEAAWNVVRNNSGRKEKKLWTRQGPGDRVLVYEAGDEYEEARFIAGEIRKNIDRYDLFAVLYRTNAQSRVIEEVLVRENISYQMVGGLRFWERKEVKDILAYLRVLDNPDDEESLRRIINVPRRGIGETTVSRLQALSRERNLTLYQALQLAGEAGLSPALRKKVTAFSELMENLGKMREYLAVDELAAEVLARSGYLAELHAEGTEQAQSREENLREFVTAAQNFVKESEDKSLTAFLTQLALISDIDTLPDSDLPQVVLMTLHSAKGLEFPVVFIAGLEEGLFPHLRSFETADGIEEERRLCYVGITRARRRLYLSYARQRNLYGQRMRNLTSRFLAEIPPECSDRAAARVATPLFPAAAPRVNGTIPAPVAQPPGQAENLRAGDRVEHAKWGIGVVQATDTLSDGDTVLTISFPSIGFKKVIARYAPLRRL
jgi:DNA helicase-2/ATP-dependent DNA helicase PcrA